MKDFASGIIPSLLAVIVSKLSIITSHQNTVYQNDPHHARAEFVYRRARHPQICSIEIEILCVYCHFFHLTFSLEGDRDRDRV